MGGGHNGLVNGAYLAKSGLRTLILERRHLVGGAAITEELRPGFWFTTFSYALSLLRPDIIHDLELVKHGFMPLLMSSRFAPGRSRATTCCSARTTPRISRRSHGTRSTTRTRTTSTATTWIGSARRSSRSWTRSRRTSSATIPEELLALGRIGARLRKLDKRVLHNAVRLLTGSAADFLDDYFDSELLKGYLASSSIIGTKVGPRSQGSGLVLLYHSLGEHDGEFGSWAFHKGGNGGFTQVLARAAQSFGAEILLESPVEAVITKDGRATGVALADGTEYHAGTVISALDPRRTFLELVDPSELPDDLVEHIRRFRFQGTSSKVNFALDGLPDYPGPRARSRTTFAASPISDRRWTTWSARSTTRSTAGTASARISTWPSSRRSIRTWRHPASTSSAASSSTPRTSCARVTGTPSRRTWATPSSGRSSRSSRGSAISSSSARS
ncbi:MAG: NAD(P)/FAD-dependent oxidoreductase [Candidatus Limnocylindrales bacterium]